MKKKIKKKMKKKMKKNLKNNNIIFYCFFFRFIVLCFMFLPIFKDLLRVVDIWAILKLV